jgi:hypothetical protein
MPQTDPHKTRCFIPSREFNRRRWALRALRRPTVERGLHPVLDNSVPWATPPRTVAEALAISDAIEQNSAEIRARLLSP